MANISTKSQRHHYIPQFLLNNFVDQDGYLWVADTAQQRTYKTTPKNAFVQRDLYVKHDIARSTKTYEYEEMFSKMEGAVAPVIHKLIQRAREGKHSNLSPREQRVLKEFLLALARRTPDSQRRISQAGDRDAFYEAAKAVAEKENFELADRETLYADPSILEIKEKVESNVHAGFAIGVSDREKREIERFSSKTGFGVARIVNPRRSFVIGSHGVAIVEAVRQRDMAAGTWLPIAHDVALLVTAFPDREFFLSLGDEATHESLIRRINLASIRLSHTTAGRSEALVGSLMQRAARER